jgi:D-xylose transport system permease protein
VVLAVGFSVLVLAFVATMNAYRLGDKTEAQGVPIPVVIWGVVVMIVSFIVRRTRFGRYVFAIGGNPEAARLVGIPVRRVTLQLFLLLSVTITIAAAVAVARLNAGTNSMGTGMELYVIAAAVIGGTSFAGGIGTIPGAILGALVMQSLQYGLGFLGFNSPIVNIVAAVVLVTVVGIDSWNRRRGS